MNQARINELRTELEHERISYSELAEIQDAFDELVASGTELRDLPENAMAGDMLDGLEDELHNQTHFTEGISL